MAEKNLAEVFLHQGLLDQAALYYGRALDKDSSNAGTLNDLGLTFLQGGQLDQAILCFGKAAHAQTNDLDIVTNLEATRLLRARVQAANIAREIVQPAFAAALNSCGLTLAQDGRLPAAIVCFRKAARVQPDQAEFFANWGDALLKQGETAAAITPLTHAIELKPDSLHATCSLAWILATSPTASLRDADRAVQLAQRARDLTEGKDVRALRTLAASCAEAGNFTQALEIANQSRHLAEAQGDAEWTTMLDSDLASYRNRRPLRESQTPVLSPAIGSR